MNNFVKKIAAALAVVLGVTSFVGCGSKEGVDNTKPETEVEENKEEVKEEEKKEEVVEEEKKEEVVEEEKKEEIKEEPKEEVVEKVEVQKEEPKKEEPKKEEPKKEEPKKEEPKKEPQVEVYNMAGQLGKVTVSSSLNVRSKPSTSASVVKSLSNGSLVALQEGYSNGWYKVNLPNNKVGYVSNKYVKVIDTAEKYLTSDVKINGIVIKKGELVTIVGSNGENFICKYKDLNFEISGQILSSYKSENPPKQEKPQSKPQAGKQIATYTTYYDASVKGRSQNIALASKAISVRLEPGQEFVWSRIVGKASSEKGYKPAPVFSGNKVVQGVGGGVCQVSTTLYGAVLNAGMKVTERHRHSMPVTYGEPGKDATVSYGSLDFRFINTKDYPVQIVATANGGTLTVTFNRAN